MKVIVLSALLAIVLFQAVDSASTKTQRLRCHVCTSPPMCKQHNEEECRQGQDTCQRSHMAIRSPSGNENRNNYYASTSQGIMVLERLCTTQKRCEIAKKNVHRSVSVECCNDPLCNS